MNRFETWFEEEGNDMLPCEEALEVAWKNGEYAAREDYESRTCENCKNSKYEEGKQPDGLIWVEEECLVYGDGFVPSMIDNDGCNKWEKKDDL